MFRSTRFKADSFSVQCSGDVFTTSEFTNLCVPSTLVFTKKKFPHRYYVLNKKRSDVARSSPGFYRHNLPSIMIRNHPSTLSSDKSLQGTKMCDWDWDSRVLTGWVATCQLELPPSVPSPVNGFPQFSSGGAIQRQLWPLVYP